MLEFCNRAVSTSTESGGGVPERRSLESSSLSIKAHEATSGSRPVSATSASTSAGAGLGFMPDESFAKRCSTATCTGQPCWSRERNSTRATFSNLRTASFTSAENPLSSCSKAGDGDAGEYPGLWGEYTAKSRCDDGPIAGSSSSLLLSVLRARL
eukprot:Mycagemm_TRINITY_DN10771_c0_g1::TRINITY_DN10771_c0_g1_i1::g.2631::m.2631 type:complete len:155 gc:universal TRINITY_DN10771_c0_g1_i1:208-672(+)